MTEDIIERLNKATPYGLEDFALLVDAAAEIERLRAAGDALVKAVGDLRIGSFVDALPVVAAMQDWNKTSNTKEES